MALGDILRRDEEVEDCEEADDRHDEDECNAFHRHIDVHAVQPFLCVIHARTRDGLLYPVDDGAGERHECPDGSDAHRTRADKAHLLLVDRTCELLECHAVGHHLCHGEVGDKSRPCDEDPHEHSDSACNTDEVACTHKRR